MAAFRDSSSSTTHRDRSRINDQPSLQLPQQPLTTTTQHPLLITHPPHSHSPTMIVGIGTDLLHIPRIKALIAKRGAPTLARRILSPRELTEFKALIRGKLDVAQAGSGAGAGAGAGTGAKGGKVGAKGGKGEPEVTSFRTILKGLNRNIENDAVTRFLASR